MTRNTQAAILFMSGRPDILGFVITYFFFFTLDDCLWRNSYLVGLSNAVYFLHTHNIAHRDIKLENIVVDETRDRILLIDFGSIAASPYRA